jgi:PTS system beta-glucosides-specific IIC component
MTGKMSLFGNLIAAPSIELAAPVEGEAVPLREVQDPTFGEEILGKGMAVRPEQGRGLCPV